MQREIKFRAWDAVNKMMDCDVFINGDGSVYDYASPTYNTPNIEIERQYFTIMQYTGMQDECGEDIYEGDIIIWEYSKKPQEVFWDNSICGFSTKYYHLWRTVKKVKVVGNIYENPELMEVK